MKKICFIFFVLVLRISRVHSQIHYSERNEPNFDSTNILPAHLIVEGTITKITYFRDTTIKFLDRDISYDDNGVWFAKYEVELHKIFKGNASKTINIISPLFGGGVIEVDEKKYKLYGTFANTNKGHNYQMHNTGIFFLYNNSPTDTGYVPNTYRFKKYHGRRDQNFIGGYDNINYSGAGYYQDSTLYGFNLIEDMYKFIEKCTHRKSKDISHKKFELLNSLEKRRNFINAYFVDSIASETFKSQLENGTINQYNKDSYPYNSQNRLDKTPLFIK